MMFAKFYMFIFLTLTMAGGIMGVKSIEQKQEEIVTASETLSPVVVENGVIEFTNAKRYRKVCADNAYVYGSPQEIGEPYYLLSIGTQIEIREISRGTPEPWAMIEPAKWLKMTALCGNR